MRCGTAVAVLAIVLAGTAQAETATRILNLHSEPCAKPRADWILTALFDQSRLSGGRSDWFQAAVELLHRASPELIVGARVESRSRNDSTDVLYTALVSHAPATAVEWHAAATFASAPAFSAEQAYTIGGEWRFSKPLSALFDYARLEFPAGSINQFKPGLAWWFSDCTFLTGRYAYGRAFGDADYDAYLLRLDLGDVGLPLNGRLALSHAHGADPEKQTGFPAVLTTADSYSLYSHWPLARRFELIVGAEYEDRKDTYTRTTGTVGLSLRF